MFFTAILFSKICKHGPINIVFHEVHASFFVISHGDGFALKVLESTSP